MTSESGQHPVRCSWTLLLGPGPALDDCLPLLETLAAGRGGTRPEGIELLETWQSLFCEFPDGGRILADSFTIEAKYVGLIEAFLAHHLDWELWLVGDDPGSPTSRELLRLDSVSWIPAPIDVASLRAAVEPPAWLELEEEIPEPEPPTPADFAAALEPDPGPELEAETEDLAQVEPAAKVEDDLITQVEAILRGEGGPASATATAPSQRTRVQRGGPELELAPTSDAPEVELDIDEREALAQPESPGIEAPPLPRTPRAPALYFRHQVADLADLVQCADLSLEAAADSLDDGGDAFALRLDELRADLARLSQFTRTLAFLAAPPGPGSQVFDLAPMLTEMLTARRSEPDAPRYLIRTPEPLEVRSDRVLLTQALDALLFLCHWCAGPEGSVRVEGQPIDGSLAEAGGADEVRVSIRFPAGDFADLAPAEILEPYALRRRLPELGPNALAAASGILRGQGGRLELRAEAGGGLEWLLYLPQAE